MRSLTVLARLSFAACAACFLLACAEESPVTQRTPHLRGQRPQWPTSLGAPPSLHLNGRRGRIGAGRPDGWAQFGSPQHGSPQHGSPQHGSPQHGSPQHGSPRQFRGAAPLQLATRNKATTATPTNRRPASPVRFDRFRTMAFPGTRGARGVPSSASCLAHVSVAIRRSGPRRRDSGPRAFFPALGAFFPSTSETLPGISLSVRASVCWTLVEAGGYLPAD